MTQMGVIRESKSPYASPVVVVRKKDGTNRVCVDYRKLNRLTVFDPAPGNTAEEIFQKMAKKKYFTIIDLSKGYWQIPYSGERCCQDGVCYTGRDLRIYQYAIRNG